jgi:DTW domain-containing protein YfiP
LSLASTPVYNAANTITITTSAESKVTFLANGKRIPGCASKNTTSLTATCSWKPTIHGFVTLSAQIVPIDNNYPTSTSLLSARHVAKRTGLR